MGGTWGRPKLELKYEKFEKALFGTVQKVDEANESYVARHEVQFEDLINMGATLEEMRAYILLRNSNLPSDDRKRIIVEAKGNLKYDDVTSSLPLLGSRFFNEIQGSSKNMGKKTYDVLLADDDEEPEYPTELGETVLQATEIPEDQLVDWFSQEGDQDALLISQFEDMVIETLQNDSETAAALNAYVEARNRLLFKAKSRGFWGQQSTKRKEQVQGQRCERWSFLIPTTSIASPKDRRKHMQNLQSKGPLEVGMPEQGQDEDRTAFHWCSSFRRGGRQFIS